MALTNAMLTGFSGIKSNSTAVDTVGDNLANLNTTAFKGQRTLFETLLYRTVSEGSGPTAESGGTLPRQVGTGETVAAVQRNFRQGPIEATGFQSDLAIQGDGFFLLERPGGETVYTRDGAFRLDVDQRLVSTNGDAVQVFPADDTGAIDTATLSDLVVPLGSASEAIPTTRVVMDGRLDAGANVAGAGSVAQSDPFVTTSGAPASSTTALTDLVNSENVPFFAGGDVLRFNATKGGLAMPSATFVVGTDGSTLGDLAAFMQDWAGIDPGAGGDGAPGITVSAGPDPAAGTLVVRSMPGAINAVELNASSIVNTTGVIASPTAFETTTPATGEGVTTSFLVYDSLGTPLEVRMRMSMESKSDSGTTWRYYAESAADSDLSPLLGTGTVNFDANGQFVSATGAEISIDRVGSGAVTPLAFTLDFSRLTGLTSADGSSELVMADQNGAPAGIMTGYSIDRDGIVVGSFSNEQTRVLGQIALATFINSEGLIARSENVFVPGPNSGDPTVRVPQTGTAGAIVSGSLEGGNVELAREFINLISASTGITSAGRVVRTADDLLQRLMTLVR